MTETGYVILREFASEFDGTWTTAIGFAATEQLARDLVTLAELQLEHVRGLPAPPSLNPTPFYSKSGAFDMAGWNKSFAEYQVAMQEYLAKAKSILTVDHALENDFHDDGLQYSFEPVLFHKELP